MIDRFGEPPISVLNLIDSVLIRNYAKELKIIDVSQKRDVVYFKLTKDSPIENILKYVSNNRIELYVSGSTSPILVYKPINFASKSISKNILKILKDINDLKGE